MTEDTTLAAVRERLIEGRDALGATAPHPPVTAVFARARRRRGQRALTAAGASLATAGVAVTVALQMQAGPLRPVHPHGPEPAQAVPARQAVHIHLAAAWSVDTNADGTVTFRMRDTSDPARLQQALRKAGVPALVRFGQICLARGRHVLLPTRGIVTGPGSSARTEPKLQSIFMAAGRGKMATGDKLLGWTWTIHPAAIPHGARFVISAVPPGAAIAGHVQAAWEFVPASAPLDCTATPPALDGA